MLDQASDELKETICESFNTSVKQVYQDVETLKQWIKTQPHLPQCQSDTMLAAFIIACKNRLERAKEKIDNYYTVRGQIPDLFADRNPMDKEIQVSGEEVQLYTLPKLTPDGCRVVISTFTKKDASNYNIWVFFKRMIATEDIKLNREAFVKGVYLVFDDKNFTMGHVFKVTPTVCKDVMYCAQDVLPMIIKGVIFINAPSYLEIVLKIIKPFMKSKIFQRVHVHSGGAEVLQKYFPKEMLPKDYGGESDTSESLNDAWMKCLEDHQDWLVNEGSLTVDEKKRSKAKPSKKSKGYEEIQGSFKTLCID